MLLPALALAAIADAPPAAPPQDGTRPHSHTHAPAEIEEAHGPLLFQVTYTAELIGNAAGGLRRGARYLDNLDIVFEADLEKVAGWTGAQLHLYGLYNNGSSISDWVGDSHAVSNIETGVRAFRLYEAWIDQKFGERVSLRAGLYDLNSEFDALDASGLFVGSAHGIGTDFSQSGQNGPSIFPSTSLAARIQVEPAKGWAARAAVLDGVPGDPARPGRTVVRLSKDEGALLVGEVQAPLGEGGKLLLGHWRYTARFDLTDGSGTATGNSGTYLRAELPLSAAPGRRLDGFARFGTASGRFNMFDFFISTGLKFTGWIPGRDEDEFGIALAAGFTAEPWRTATGASAAEIAIEATWRTQLSPWLAVQPHAQYIRRPSADPSVADALVLGIRTEIGVDLFGL
ncbi:carbohydrate porin [Sphingomonas koreensis]|jgi:porin|uniref:Carbohydrate porin n=1 Tax=Sphingomonas koreensis TaxID=93064 RepID=A0A1L6JEP0_9SPHN|nr:carbohydrate porin [Sphingomonas koreensis]APR54383.1 carbohydrate porin [Sphingomonas koreensis]MDC7809411.1 carbohydrate porin [Sphingomonas koreensis]RSU16982.1 carbohydrate porin [Sphingomonas koreensis]RSU18621.1 carbohydrate porin [Sphingomonas koreensis]RSU20809.1 carbohydrate porin [Sphingomonas koreensis]